MQKRRISSNSTIVTWAISCLAFLMVPAADLGPTYSQERRSTAKQDASIDFERAHQLLKKRMSGGKLSQSEEAYLKRAIEARQNRQSSGGPAWNAAPPTPRDSVGLTPISEMTAEDRYQGQDGGLYGAGRNTPPEAHQQVAQKTLRLIEPLDSLGKPSRSGKIVFISISMSNATQEFSRMKRLADADKQKSQELIIVDCAQGGQTMSQWAQPASRAWTVAEQRLYATNVTPDQVQLAWIKLANAGPRGSLEQHGKTLQQDTLAVLQNAKERYPNLRIAYLSSRVYGGYATTNLNPEPYAYEGAFVVRWLIQAQMNGDSGYEFDETSDRAQIPLLLWGPYLWADGKTPRSDDRFFYLREDFAEDGTHPSEKGREKIAGLMHEFFKTSPLTKSWFLDAPREFAR